MLSIGRVRRGERGKRYYLVLHAEDYYLRKGSGEPPGLWYGKGCERFGLHGLVGQDAFCKFFAGKGLKGEGLRRQQKNGRPGFDLTYSVSKDLSIIYMLAGPELRRKIEAAIYAAVRESLGYVENEVCKTRLGAGGSEVVKGEGLTAALFLHLISRGLDPQLHVHAVVFNFTRAPDGKYRALDATRIYDHAHAAGALFRTELAARIEKLGFEIERDRFSFSIKGVPQPVKEEFSKRSEQIRKALGDKVATARRRAALTLISREPKRDVDRDKLFAEWEETAKRHGFTAERVKELVADPKVKVRDEQRELREAVQAAVSDLTSTKSSFTARELLEKTAIEGQTRGLLAKQVCEGVLHELEHARRSPDHAHLVCLGQHRDGYERFTTKELHKYEQEIIETVERRRQSTEHRVQDASLAKALSTEPNLKAEQQTATTHMTQGQGATVCICGWAGTGKTTTVGVARQAWEKDGYKVLGCALSGKAAHELEAGAQVKSVTIAKLIYDLDHRGHGNRVSLDSKTVLIVDEAGMVGTKALHRLVMETARAHARLVLIGDANQLQSIDAGGGFAGLSKRLGCVELKEIIRQRDPADRQAIRDLVKGNTVRAVRSYRKRGLLILGEDRADTMERLVADWHKDKTPIQERLILSSTNRQAATLNQLCQEARRSELGQGATVTVRDGVKVHAGDRVLFTRNDKRVGVHNGDLGTVIRVTGSGANPEQGEAMTVKLDSGRVRTVSLAAYDPHDMTLGYCVTTHKAQGATVNNAYVFLSGMMTDQQMSYVQASRARHETRFYTIDDEAGPGLSDLTQAMSRSRKKTMAHDAIEEEARQRQSRGMRYELRSEL